MVSEGLTSFLPTAIAARRERGADAPDGSARPADAMGLNRDEFSKLVDLQNRMRDIFRAAARTNTAVYAWDPRGLAAFEFDMSEPAVDFTESSGIRETTDSLRVIAGETGGRVIVNVDNSVPSLRQMLMDSTASCLLQYPSTEAPRDGRFHEIAVHVKRTGSRAARPQRILGIRARGRGARVAIRQPFPSE